MLKLILDNSMLLCVLD